MSAGFRLLALFILSVAFAQKKQVTNEWFVFNPVSDPAHSIIDISSWLDKPAGKHGFVSVGGKDFVFEDGTPVKFWGVNIGSNKAFVDNEEAARWARFMSMYGINAVRFHKFTWEATDGIRSTIITADKWDKFDFFCRQLRDRGIYYGWSHIYGHRLLPADSSRVLAYSEITQTKFPWSHLNGTSSSIVNFAEDLQDLNIELTVNMLNHINPQTGLKYANDPALSFIELQNEDNIFWSAIEETLKQTPTYRSLLCRKFSVWLHKKYNTQAKLREAWLNKGLSPGETLQKKNIYPHPNHGIFSYEYEQAVKNKKKVPQHILDRAEFLYEEQVKFYTRFIKAIRATGYKGVIVGSCWQAGSGITHFYNLHSDYLAGVIDRHNYFGGGTGHSLRPGKFDNRAMLMQPGSGLLSTGFQQVFDRPFQLSEWMSLVPNEWVAESAPIVAAYGMGLQGWDASFSFAMDHSHYTPTIQSGHGVYNVTSPTHLGVYPALATMIYRGDIKEGPNFVNRNIQMKDLKNGSLLWNERTSQQYDIKSFETDFPLASLAVGPVTLSFDKPGAVNRGNYEPYIDKRLGKILSNTGELTWYYSDRACFTINTGGTKALVGFPSKESYEFNDLSIQTNNHFAVVFVSSMEKDKPLAASKTWLITTIARARNTGMKFNADTTELIEVGNSPIQLEAVDVTVSFRKQEYPVVYVLDHSGHRTGETLTVANGSVRLNGNLTKAIYYEIKFP
jgi:hypothetical protein